MISKEQFLASSLREIEIIKHLYAKITPEMLSYRPSEKQRSLLELLQYISHFAKIESRMIYSGKPLTNFGAAFKEAYEMPPGQFLAAMDAQAEELKNVFSKITDAE